MRQISVRYCGWGEDWPLGCVADDGTTLLFEYSPEALAQRLELSPLKLKLRAAAYGDFPRFLHRLPGLVADSLPDGWGMLLMDRLFRAQGTAHPEPLDRLAFIADRGMGALRFVPGMDAETALPDWNLLALAEENRRALDDEADVALRALALTGGSPQGARPKALVWYDPATGHVSTRDPALAISNHGSPAHAASPWLVKFPAQGEHKEVCAIEALYAGLARDCGLDMPDTALFDLSSTLAAFAVARFDREAGVRVPVHSLAGLLHADFRIPGSVDYTALLRATRLMTRDEREVESTYARAVFNVLLHNRDDHPKNFAWRLGRDRRWRVAPAFDLTFSAGPNGQHHMDVCGEGGVITRSHLLRLATEGGVPLKTANEIMQQILEPARHFTQRAADFPIRRSTIEKMAARVKRCCDFASA